MQGLIYFTKENRTDPLSSFRIIVIFVKTLAELSPFLVALSAWVQVPPISVTPVEKKQNLKKKFHSLFVFVFSLHILMNNLL